MNIKKSALAILGIIILLGGIAIGAFLVQQNQNVNEKAAPATTAFISPASSEVGQNKNFSFWVKMDSGVNAVTGVDIRLKFNKEAFEITSLEKGSGIQDLENTVASTFDNGNGTLKYIVFTLDKTKAVSDSQIEVLRINAKTKGSAQLGDQTISFDNLTAASGTTETQNIITETTPGKLTIVSGNGANDINIEGEPNSCGGTCGSNNNCKANYFCFEGFCRNPLCPSDKTCGCATAKPTTKSTTKATSTAKAVKTPEVVYLSPGPGSRITATYTPASVPTDLPYQATEAKPKNKFMTYFVAGLGLLGIIFIVLGIKSAVSKTSTPVDNSPKNW